MAARASLAALPTVYPAIPVQRCWAHKIRNVLGKVRKGDYDAVEAGLHAIMNATTRPQARSAARRFADRWQGAHAKAVACPRNDLDELLAGWRYKTIEERKAVRTTNAIEHRFREGGPGRWACSGTGPPWTASRSPSSPTKTQPAELPPSSPRHKSFDVTHGLGGLRPRPGLGTLAGVGTTSCPTSTCARSSAG